MTVNSRQAKVQRRCVAAVTLIMLLFCFALGPTALAGANRQLSARKNPKISGPLGQTDKICKEVQNSDTEGGPPTLIADTCWYYYTIDPGEETNLGADYAIVWLQGFVDVESPGECIKAIRMTLSVPRHVQVEELTPMEEQSADKPTSVTSKLTVNTVNAVTPVEASIKNDFILYPNQLSGPQVAPPSGNPIQDLFVTFQWDWEGSTNQPLGFAVGISLTQDIGSHGVNGRIQPIFSFSGAALPC